MIADTNPDRTGYTSVRIIALIVHSEKDLDEGRMAPIVVGSKLFPQISDTGLSGKRPLPSYRVAEVLRLWLFIPSLLRIAATNLLDSREREHAKCS
jgi:hypothetical protein